MVSSKFLVNSDTERMAAARYVVEDFTGQLGLNRHNALRVGLLVEETLGMVKGMVDQFYGQLWLEGDQQQCSIHLEATADMNSDRKHDLLSVSSSGKNAASKGFMGMLGDVFSSVMNNYTDAMDAVYGSGVARYGVVVPGSLGSAEFYDCTPVWTLQQYRTELESEEEDLDRKAALGDLEKSIVANLADDVVVGVRKDRIELIIKKSFQ